MHSWFSGILIENPDKEQLWEKGLTSVFRVKRMQSILVGKAQQREHKAGRSHFIHTQEAESEREQEVGQGYALSKPASSDTLPARLHLLKGP